MSHANACQDNLKRYVLFLGHRGIPTGYFHISFFWVFRLEVLSSHIFKFLVYFRERISFALFRTAYYKYLCPCFFCSAHFFLITSGHTAFLRYKISYFILANDSLIHLCSKRSLHCNNLFSANTLLRTKRKTFHTWKYPYIQSMLYSF